MHTLMLLFNCVLFFMLIIVNLTMTEFVMRSKPQSVQECLFKEKSIHTLCEEHSAVISRLLPLGIKLRARHLGTRLGGLKRSSHARGYLMKKTKKVISCNKLKEVNS